MIIPGAIAVETEYLEPAILREPILAQPAIEVTASTNLTTMLSTVVMHMVNGKNFRSVLTTACARPRKPPKLLDEGEHSRS
jgi:hypothetical protein